MKGKRTPARQRAALDALRQGATRQAAAAAAGVSRQTLWRWMQDTDYATAIEQAEGMAEMNMTTVVSDAAERSWQAAAWWLERRRPHDFSRHERVTIADARDMAERMARAEGLDPAEVLAEAERIAREYMNGEQP